jgi:uncharacterized protein (TIGR03437 family)
VRIFPSLSLAALCVVQSIAGPLSFEQRSPGHFMARLPMGTAEFRPDHVTAGGVTLRFPDASSNARMEGIGASAPSTYLGRGFSRTFSQFPKLAIRNLYPGIDAVFYGNGQSLEYDLEVAPGASPDKIRISVEGARVEIDGEGNLKMDSSTGVVRQMLPRVIQANRQIGASYVLLGHNAVGIRLGKHDARLPLTIDPVLEYTHSFGGSGVSAANSVATDAQGNIYVAGVSNSTDFPTTTNGFETHLGPPLVALSNAGQTITPLPVGPEQNVLAIGGTPDGKTLYAATPGGIYISVDGGATWPAKAPLPAVPPGGGSDQLAVNSIAVNTLDSSRFCVATNFGLFFRCSNDGLPISGTGYVSVQSLFITPGTGNILYATSAGHVYKSIDTGTNWQQLNPTYPGEPPIQTIPYSNTLAALGPNGNDLYVINGNGNLLKSTDQGATWQLLSPQLYQATLLAIDPSNAANIYFRNSAGIHSSVDGGVTFSLTAPSFGTDSGTSLAVDSSGTLYAGFSNRVYVSTDKGATLTPLSQLPLSAQLLGTIGNRAYVATQLDQAPYVIKYDPTGSRILYSTFFGDGGVILGGLTVDSQGEAVLAGTTYNPHFPTTIPAPSPAGPAKNDGFVVKLSADGTRLVYSRLLGGSMNVYAQAVAADSSGAVYVTGNTNSSDLPTTPNAFQTTFPTASCPRTTSMFPGNQNLGTHTFVTKLSADGNSLIYSTFVTGSCGSSGNGLTIDPAGEAIVVGYTATPDFPVSAGSYQPAFPGPSNQPSPPSLLYAGFVAKLSAAGDKLLAGSYIGGGFQTSANAATLDSAGNVYVTGSTQGITPGATPGAFQTKLNDSCAPMLGFGAGTAPGGTGDAFILELDPALSIARYLTYLGGGCGDAGTSISLDASGNTWVTGSTVSPDFPLRAPFQGSAINTNSYFGFVSELNPDGSQLLFSSMTNGTGLALDPTGNVYLAGANGRSALLQKINPASTPAVIIDATQPTVAFPPTFLSPFGNYIAPGQLMQITGRNLGPVIQANAQLDAYNRLPFTVANTTVYFDDIPAPLISVQANSITCFAPFEITQGTQISVVFNGQRSNAVRTAVAAVASQILSIANQDGTANSASSPAKLGSVIALYVSGQGVTNPLSVDGLVNSFPLPVPVALPSIFIGQTQIQPLFAGAAPGLISGINQVNIQLPSTISPSSQVAFAIGIGSANASIFIKP